MIVTAECECHPTEEKEKVCQAMHNIFPEGEITGDEHLTLVCESGEKLRNLIWDTQIRDSARSVLLRGRTDDSIHFTLNKQAAFMGKISFQDEHSALGNISVVIRDDNIDEVIDYLAESTIKEEDE
ncbi:RNA-binding domain-containing protein [Candidatus Methanomassiliicoccus intestinalis]|jgi:UPF0201 protein tpen_0695|uniref:UPF0201 protein MMINT_17970 n=2 Tax=Candidatus Methanomassiliicoccus intestinalis TaxID=1406512 RepID=R9TBK1_METII|nr:RNA-binding domain-containing protein [Candidatus Methanomassiliicoccus intestinalis]AGN27081.1 hypothetical protein MMINT_17970 [Candidatus Methanomassiliicoccus intestinalis Issoire-Mx1]TQS80948.1 MAG: hypothetical protein A3206_04445 [Candidatus Methanomassiliicoccus intestinalis]TQS83940.1 MAG: hypothetical protein A3207_06330 [Candidatus Methanomassiliicoccus intestinalis]